MSVKSGLASSRMFIKDSYTSWHGLPTKQQKNFLIFIRKQLKSGGLEPVLIRTDYVLHRILSSFPRI